MGIGVFAEDGKRIIKFVSNEKIEVISEISVDCNSLWFKSGWDFEFINSFSYSFDGVSFKQAGDKTKLVSNDYRGDYIGFF